MRDKNLTKTYFSGKPFILILGSILDELMGKTLETKKKILNLLRKNNMTITELSRELNLSTATISQHLDDLQRIGAIEKIDNEHFKKLKYYKVREAVNMNIAKYVIGALVLVATVSLVYFYSAHRGSNPYTHASQVLTTNTSSNTTQAVAPKIGGGSFACPLITYNLNGTITNYSGFMLYYLNSSHGKVADYVLGGSSSGTLYLSEFVNHVLDQNNTLLTTNRIHYAEITRVGSHNSTAPGINVTISPSTYNAVNNTTINFTVGISTMNAEHETYWLRIDGPCGGGVPYVLLTIGNRPYNGTATPPVNIYA